VLGSELLGCATILGLEHNGADDGPGADGATPGEDGATLGEDGIVPGSDAPSGDDVPPGEDAPHRDGGGDASCSGSWCECNAPTAQFCDDFDEPDALGGFSFILEAGTVTITNDQKVSPPNAMAAMIQQNNFGAAAVALRSFPGAPNKRYVVRFDLFIEGTCQKVSLPDTILALRVTAANRATVNRLDTDASGLVLGQDNSYYLAVQPVPRDTWQTVTFTVDFTGAQPTEQIDTSGTFPLNIAGGPDGTIYLEIGQNSAPSFACRVHIDNLTFEASQ
jgi:hypothetical protein